MATATKFKINGRTLAPEIQLPSPSATVLDLKKAIQSQIGLAVARQRLFHKGDGELLNHRSIESYKLKAEKQGKSSAVVNLDLTVEPLPKKKRGERIPFVVKFGNEKATFNFRETDTVNDLGWEFSGRFKTSFLRAKLRCGGMELPPFFHGDDYISLYEYYLSEGTVLEVAAADNKTFPPSFYNAQ